jgi:hypothetical protein
MVPPSWPLLVSPSWSGEIRESNPYSVTVLAEPAKKKKKAQRGVDTYG